MAQHRQAARTHKARRWGAGILLCTAGLLGLAYWHGTQVQAQHAVPRWTDGVAVCMAEDGSTPGQAFPCRWDAHYQGNGIGQTFTLDGPAS